MTRGGETFRLLLAGLAMLVIAGAIGAIAWRPELRGTFDATRTRAYSLSPQTRSLLAGLEGDWSVSVILTPAGVDADLRRQVDEVLRRFARTAPSLDVTTVDPTDPRSIAAYEGLLSRLRAMEQRTLDRYETALDDGEAAFDELRLFAERVSSSLDVAMSRLASGDARSQQASQELAQRTALLTVLARDGGMLSDEIRRTRTPGEDVPIPEYDAARSILREALSQWADQLQALAALLDGWVRSPGVPSDVRGFARATAPEARDLATRLVSTSEVLFGLPELQLARIGRQLAGGEAAVVLGPTRAAVIPAADLFPQVAGGRGGPTVDRRFRGEQVIAAAIRSLEVDIMPMVVFVHAEATDLLRASNNATDVTGVEQVLDASRYAVREWAVGRDERPVAAPGQPVVWIPIAPLNRSGIDTSPAERGLLDVVVRLRDEGEPLMLGLYPSLRPRYGLDDPWTEVLAPLGVEADTGSVLVESTPLGADRFAVSAGAALQSLDADHPISAAVDGQQLALSLPVRLEIVDSADASDAALVDRTSVAAVAPSPTRWFESEWATGALPSSAPPGGALMDPASLIVAVERPHPRGTESGVAVPGRQRILVVGSGEWMRTRTADAVADVGGGRVALVNPGNHELALAGTAWLAGQDDLVAASSAGGQVSRLRDIDSAVRTRWAIGTVLVAPGAIILLGAGVWFIRRRSS